MLKVLFFIALFGILHSYLLFPLLMRFLGLFKKVKSVSNTENLPHIEIIFAAYNEAAVIEKKIKSCFSSNYPTEKITVHIGSDASNDGTDEIINHLKEEFPNLKLTRFQGRTGKSSIINELVKQSKCDNLILTDANIIFRKDTIPYLVEKMHGTEAGIVGGKIEYLKVKGEGIAKQENLYLRWENKLKQLESDLFGSTMGVEGGIYLIKKNLWPGIPPLFFMEDFYISMEVLLSGKPVVFEPRAKVYEDVSVHSTEEYKRKVRISIGNWQNLKAFWKPALLEFWPVGFVFLSHKVLRWFTPFFLLILLPTSTLLAKSGIFFGLFAGFYMLFIGLGLFGILFSQSNRAGWLKYPGHFIHMNLALLEGFSIFIKGVESNVWEPTKRNQK